jgi:hypothetical protein
VPVGRARCSVESQVENEAHENGTDALPRRARRLKGLKLSSPRDVALAQVGRPRAYLCAVRNSATDKGAGPLCWCSAAEGQLDTVTPGSVRVRVRNKRVRVKPTCVRFADWKGAQEGATVVASG